MNKPVNAEDLAELKAVTLNDKYTVSDQSVYMSGTQALIRLLMLQRDRDQKAGLNTGGFVSGYRGSPLGGVDQALWKAEKLLKGRNIHFNPGLNEELAATSVWGTQHVGMFPGATVDGVFSMWYGKGPGVDRSLDALKHGTAAGTSKHGGVLVLAGDDHSAKSSSLPHQSDHVFQAAGIPVFFPSSVQEILDLGIHAWAMSRYSGVWVAMKCISDVVESSASVIADADRVQIKLPTDFMLPEGGVSIRWPDPPLAQEARLLDHKLYAALAYVRANKLNYNVIDPPNARIGVIASGKAYLDTMQALTDLGLDHDACMNIGLRLHKVSVIWPLEATIARDFATGLQEILVVEEKRQLIEYALKEELYSWRDDVRPKVIGKFDERHGGEYALPQGKWLLPIKSELSPAQIAKAIASRLLRLEIPDDIRHRIEERLRAIEGVEKALAEVKAPDTRLPYYCSGCPHNTSTHVPEGSRAMAGIGCHYMAMWMPERRTGPFTQMGGEGTTWIGQAPFTTEKHVFANLGDGTYFHSGILAIRASIAAGVNITYKILFNDAVAMTGGQPVDGTLTVPQIVAQMIAERVKKVIVVSDEPEKYSPSDAEPIPAGIEIRHRDLLEDTQKELRDTAGCTVIVYDQTCAAEKRRRRKIIVDEKPLFPDPPKRLFINDAVCEGCGDCSTQSSCLSIEPVETELGRKRVINQSTCNKDYSCVKGFCPSFVTVKGGKLRKATNASSNTELIIPPLPLPALPSLDKGYDILITGVGGSGVVTVGQLIGMAAHLEGRGISTLDMTGVAQKGGAVLSHIKLGLKPEDMTAARIGLGNASVIIGCDIIVTAGEEALSKTTTGSTYAVVNSTVTPTADFIRQRDWSYPVDAAKSVIDAAVGAGNAEYVDAGSLAQRLVGDSIAANPLMLGYAWQKGWIPLSLKAMMRAIELNAVAVKQNIRAFEWGRYAAHDIVGLKKMLAPTSVIQFQKPKLLSDIIAHRVTHLTAYANASYANRYSALVQKVGAAESRVSSKTKLAEAVAHNYSKLLSYKDEYEVARLYSDPEFKRKLESSFEGDFTVEFNLAPPLLSKRNSKGELIKRSFGPWMAAAFKILARFKFLRGTPFDIVGMTAERRMERGLIKRYEETIAEVISHLTAESLDLAIQLASLPQDIRGYGHIKERSVEKADLRWTQLLKDFRNPAAVKTAQPQALIRNALK